MLTRSPPSRWLVVLAAAVSLAGCQASPKVDPALAQASPASLQELTRSTCVKTQSTLQGRSESAVRRGCDCYAGRTIKALTPDELDAFRRTGAFDESARSKALAALDVCKLQKPV